MSDEAPPFHAVYKNLETFFGPDIKSGKLEIYTENENELNIIKINGIVVWDNVPVTDFTIIFNEKGNICEVNGELFTFMGESVYSDLSKVDGLVSICPDNQKQIFCDPKIEIHDNYTAYIHYVNAEKTYFRYKKDKLLISLHINPYFLIDYHLKSNQENNDAPGIPLIYKNINFTTVKYISRQKNLDNTFEQTNELRWKSKCPSFIHLPDGENLLLDSVTFFPTASSEIYDEAHFVFTSSKDVINKYKRFTTKELYEKVTRQLPIKPEFFDDNAIDWSFLEHLPTTVILQLSKK